MLLQHGHIRALQIVIVTLYQCVWSKKEFGLVQALVRAAFSCVQTKVWLPAFGIVNVRTDMNACHCTRGLCGHRKRVCTES